MLSRNGFRRFTRWVTLLLTAFTIALSTVGVGTAVASAPAHTLAMGSETVAGQRVTYIPAFRPISPDDPSGVAPVCATDGDSSTSSDLLTVNRWAPVTSSLHTRLDADAWGDISNKIQRNQVDSTMLSVGNTMWQASTSMVELSNNFCIANGIGFTIDQKAGQLAKTLWSGGSAGGVTIVAILLIGAILMAVSRARQAPGQFAKAVIKPVMVIALFGIMMNGALKTTGSNFGTMSPGWMVNAASNVISGVSGAVAAPISDTTIGNSFATTAAQDSAKQNDASCINYMAAMRKSYKDSFGSPSSGLSASANVPLAMDSMWQLNGLSSYVRAQYGTDNNYGWATFCRGLETNARSSLVSNGDHTSVDELLAAQGMTKPSDLSTSPAFAPADNNTWDEMAVFWAACQTGDGGKSWSVAPGWGTVSNSHADDKTVTAKDCLDFYNGQGSKDDMSFNWQDDANTVQDGTKNVSNADIINGDNPQDYLNVLHGTSTGMASTSAMFYAMFSVIDLAIFGVMAGMIFVLKALLLAFGLFVFFVLLADILPIHRESQTLRYFKTTLGFVVVAFGYSLALSVMILLTGFILSVGSAMGLSGFFNVLWVSAAPIIAIVAMKMIWKKVVKAPDPFSVRGAKGYMSSAASGMIGGGAAEGVSGLFQRGKEAIPGMGRNPAAGGVMGGAGGGSAMAGGGANPQGASARSGGADPLAGGADGSGAGAAEGIDPEVAERASAAGYDVDDEGRPVAGSGDGSMDEELEAAEAQRPAAGAGQADAADNAYDYSHVQRRYDRKAQRQARREGAAQRRQWYGGRDEIAGGTSAKVANSVTARRRRAMQALRANPVRSTLHSRGAWTAVGAAGLAAGAVTAMPAAFAIAGAAGVVAAASTLSRRGRAHRQSRKLLDHREKNAFFDSMQAQAHQRNKKAVAEQAEKKADQNGSQQGSGGGQQGPTQAEPVAAGGEGGQGTTGGQSSSRGGTDHQNRVPAVADGDGLPGEQPDETLETTTEQVTGGPVGPAPKRDNTTVLPDADAPDDDVLVPAGAPVEYADAAAAPAEPYSEPVDASDTWTASTQPVPERTEAGLGQQRPDMGPSSAPARVDAGPATERDAVQPERPSESAQAPQVTQSQTDQAVQQPQPQPEPSQAASAEAAPQPRRAPEAPSRAPQQRQPEPNRQAPPAPSQAVPAQQSPSSPAPQQPSAAPVQRETQQAPTQQRQTPAAAAPAPSTRAERRESRRWFGGSREPVAPPRDGGDSVPPTKKA